MENNLGYSRLKWAQRKGKGQILAYTIRTGQSFKTLGDHLRDNENVNSPDDWLNFSQSKQSRIIKKFNLNTQDILVYLIHLERNKPHPNLSYRNNPQYEFDLRTEERLLSEFEARWSVALVAERKKLEELNRAYQIFRENGDQWPEYTTPKIKSAIIEYNPTYNPPDGLQPQGLEIAEEIFRRAILSEQVPLLIYNHPSGTRTRVWVEGSVDVNKIIEKLDRGISDLYILQIYLWIRRTPKETLLNPGKNSVHRVYYSPQQNSISLDSHVTGLRDAIDQAFPFLNLGNGHESKIRAEFRIPHPRYGVHNFIFSECMLNVEPFPSIFYYEERAALLGDKRRPDGHYRASEDGTFNNARGGYINTASVSFSLANRVTTRKIQDEIHSMNGLHNEDIPVGTEYVSINITRANSRNVLEEFIWFFVRCYHIYQEMFQRIYRYYNFFIDNFDRYEELYASKRRIEENRSALVARAPAARNAVKDPYIVAMNSLDLVVTNLSRKVANNQGARPTPISEDEVKKYDKKPFYQNGIKYLRRVLQFPLYAKKGQKKIYLVCMNDETPHIGLRPNRSEGEIPYLPRCFVSAADVGPGTPMHKYIESIEGNGPPLTAEDIPKRGRGDQVMRTNVVLEEGSLGMLHSDITSFLASQDAYRQGVARNPDGNLAQAICDALDCKAPNTSKLRKNLLSYLTACAQEYTAMGMSYEDAADQLANGHLDEMLFFRAFEELYEVNLYFFDMPSGKLAIPPYSHYHSHFLRDYRYCIIIIRNHGAEIDALVHPHCELVRKNDKCLFGSTTNNRIHQLLCDSVETYTSDGLQLYRNLFSEADLVRGIGYPCVSQMLDVAGRAYAFTFKNPDNKTSFTLGCIPIQPEPVKIDYQVHPVSDEIRSKLGKITGYSINDDVLNGSWHGMCGFNWGIFAPCTPRQATSTQLKLHGPESMFVREQSIIRRHVLLVRQHHLIIAICDYILQVYIATVPIEKRDIAKFMASNFVTRIVDKADSATIYDLGRIPSTLPEGDTVHTVLLKLHEFAPTLIDNKGRIQLYSNEMAEGIVNYVEYYYANMRAVRFSLNEVNRYLTVSRNIPNYYDSSESYNPPNGHVFMDENQLLRWKSTPQLKMYTQIQIGATTPYVYTNRNQLWLVQPTNQSDKLVALNICRHWQDSHTNIGIVSANDVAADDADVHHIIYTLDSSHQLVFYREKHRTSLQPLEILVYQINDTRKVYTSLLPLSR